ncbi:MAG TPA: hypothetical protein VFR97_02265 [Capillimicrobium sp.]|nr:hypothetical protein [Capillimicrobium sp.]
MAHSNHQGHIEPALEAATAIAARTVVALTTTQDQVAPVATRNVEPLGITGDADVEAGRRVVTYGDDNIVKAVAGASFGFGANIGVASTNGALGPVAGASGSVVWRVGTSREPAAPGEVFSLYVSKRQLSGGA